MSVTLNTLKNGVNLFIWQRVDSVEASVEIQAVLGNFLLFTVNLIINIIIIRAYIFKLHTEGLEQEQFAEKLGIAPRTLCGIEIGKNFLTADTLERIISELKITPQDLFKINHLKPQEDLVNEIIETVKSIDNREKIEIIYKIIKSFE